MFMRFYAGVFCAVFGLTFSAAAAAAAADAAARVIPAAGGAVMVDGDLSDSAWQKALQLEGFTRADGKEDEAGTRAFLMFDAQRLYIGFRCPEPRTDSLRRKAGGRDGDVFDDDCVEVFVDPSGSGLNYIHIGLNPNNALWDGIHALDIMADDQWDGVGITSGVKVMPDCWTAEIAVPFKDIGMAPVANEVWKINLGRERRAEIEGEFTSLIGTFCDGARFVPVFFDVPDKSGSAVKLQVVNRGSLGRAGNDLDRNKFEILLGGPGSAAGPVNVAVSSIQGGNRKTLVQETARAGSAPQKLAYRYQVDGAKGELIEFAVSDPEKKVLYIQSCPTHASAGSRFKPIENPLYRELLSDEDPGLAREGVLVWPSMIFLRGLKGGPKPFCIRYGIPVDAEIAYMDLADHALISVNSGVLLKNYRFAEFARRLGVRACIWPVSTKANKADPEAWLFAEPCLEKYRQSVLEIAGHGFVWAIFWGDEMRDATLKQGVRIYEGLGDKKRQEWMRTVIDPEVKETFGFGKYGMPRGKDDLDAFRWIAWHRYINDRERKLFKELRGAARAVAPDIRFVSEDHNAALHPYEFSAEADAGVHDVFTHQTNTRNFGLMSKFLADLTGGEFWPVVHCEHYLMSATPEDVREMFSAVFRNGGTGLHLYPTDSTQGAKKVFSTELSSPPRWNAMMEIADRVRRQNKLKFPKADCGIFYSNPSHQAVNPFKEYSGAEIEALYSFLGQDGLKCWFRFVDENVIVNHKGALDGFKAVFVPCAKYLGQAETDCLANYVAGGGTLICFDPEGFAWNIDGTELNAAREKIFGIKRIVRAEQDRWLKIKADSIIKSLAGKILPVFADTYTLELAPGTEVLAEFSDGSPAITRKRHDKGQAFFCAANPLNKTSARSTDWAAFFRDLGQAFGLESDRDIWRFKFPPFEREIYPPDPPGKCLTDNYLKFQEDVPLYVKNLDTKGSYSYSLAPDAWNDQGGVKDVPFGKGDLTDRREAYAANGREENPEEWAVSWNRNEPMDIVFDLKQSWAVDRIRVLYSGALPVFEAFGSADGNEWKRVGAREVEGYTEGVREASVSLERSDCRYVKLHFRARRKEGELILAEVEIWGDQAAPGPTARSGSR